jgi:hypothetical protein
VLKHATNHTQTRCTQAKNSLKLIKKILIGILLIGIIAIIGLFVFVANFEIFEEPIETELKMECDDSGLRKITMIELKGNATANTSLLIKSSDCDVDLYSDDLINSELIFSISSPNIQRSDLNFEWKDFDTLTITYKKGLWIFKQEFESKTIKPKIIFEYKTK